MSALPYPYLTPEQYLAFEEHAPIKHEYVEGRVYAMTGTNVQHGRVVQNLARLIGNALSGRPCDVFTQDMRVLVGPRSAYFYPDVVGLCGPPDIERIRGLETLRNPAFVVEVLSDSTERADRGRKALRYQRIPTLREYVLVAQDRVHAELYTPPVGGAEAWPRVDLDGPDAVLALASVGVALRLGDLYERVEFPPHPPGPRRVRERPPGGAR